MAYQHNKRWRLKNTAGRNKDRQSYYAQTAYSVNDRQRWTTAEKQLITARDRPCDTKLSKQLGRSVEAIQVMRAKIRKKWREAKQQRRKRKPKPKK